MYDLTCYLLLFIFFFVHCLQILIAMQNIAMK